MNRLQRLLSDCPRIWSFALCSTLLVLWIDTVLMIRRPLLAGGPDDWIQPFFFGQVSWIAAWSLRLPKRTLWNSLAVSGSLFAIMYLINRWQVYFSVRPAIFATSWRILLHFVGYWCLWKMLRGFLAGPEGAASRVSGGRFRMTIADLILAPVLLGVMMAYAQSYGLSLDGIARNFGAECKRVVTDIPLTLRGLSSALLGVAVDFMITGKSPDGRRPWSRLLLVLATVLLGCGLLAGSWYPTGPATSRGPEWMGILVEIATLSGLLLAARSFYGADDPFARGA
ncbi:MAG: hypothetical protein AAF958_11375 [Planctomycetota bacterium]